MIKQINPTDASQLLTSSIFIDVREVYEYQASKIEGSINMPLSCFHESVDEILSKYSDKRIILICRSGVRSEHAGLMLLQINNKLDVYNLTGGILAWIESDLEVTKVQ